MSISISIRIEQTITESESPSHGSIRPVYTPDSVSQPSQYICILVFNKSKIFFLVSRWSYQPTLGGRFYSQNIGILIYIQIEDKSKGWSCEPTKLIGQLSFSRKPVAGEGRGKHKNSNKSQILLCIKGRWNIKVGLALANWYPQDTTIYLGGDAQWNERVDVFRLLGSSRNLSGTWR